MLPHIRGQLQIMLAELTENERRDFSADAMTLLERLKNKSKKYPDLASHAEGLKKLGTLEEQLAYLTVIALTWSCWSWNNDALTKDLAFLLLTPKKEGTEIQAIESWKEKRLAEDNDRSAKLLEQCRDAFRQKDFFTCGKAAEGILALRFAPDLVRAEAYYMLSVCCAEHGYKRSCPLPSPKELMLRAYKFGYAGAREVLLNKYGFDAAPLLLRPHAKALHGTARVVSNCINQYTKTVLQSAPDTLRKEADDALKKKEAAEKWVYCAPGKKPFRILWTSARRPATCCLMMTRKRISMICYVFWTGSPLWSAAIRSARSSLPGTGAELRSICEPLRIVMPRWSIQL